MHFETKCHEANFILRNIYLAEGELYYTGDKPRDSKPPSCLIVRLFNDVVDLQRPDGNVSNLYAGGGWFQSRP